MTIAICIALIIFGGCLIWQLYHGVINANNHIFSLVALLLSATVIIGCYVGVNYKLKEELPTEDEVGTGVLYNVDLALESKNEYSRKIAQFAKENSNAEFIDITVDKAHDIYLLEVICNNGATETFILNSWEMYELLPFVEFDKIPNVE